MSCLPKPHSQILKQFASDASKRMSIDSWVPWPCFLPGESLATAIPSPAPPQRCQSFPIQVSKYFIITI